MAFLSQVIIWEVWALLFALFATVVLQLLTGQINSSRLLMRKDGNRSFSPERVQLLLATFAAAFEYLSQVLKDPSHLPEVTPRWIALLGGSHAVYLGHRFYLNRPDKKK